MPLTSWITIMVAKMKVVIVVPAYNEAKYIGHFLDKLLSVTKKVVVVNDGSTDFTEKIVSSKGVTCLTHITNLGKGASLKTGCDYAFKKMGADAVIIMDGDGQHNVEDLSGFTRELKKGTGVVLGVRMLDASMPLMRVLGNKAISVLINLLFGGYISDIPSGYKAFTKNAYHKLKWKSSGYEVETEIAVRIAKLGIDYQEIPISTIYHDKEYGFNLLDAFTILLKLPYWIWK